MSSIYVHPHFASRATHHVLDRAGRAGSALLATGAALLGALRDLFIADESESELRKLYVLTGSADTVSPQLLEALYRMQALDRG
jgi:hypothetical protein